MTWREFGLRTMCRGVNQLGKRYYKNQKKSLDELRSDDYALVVFDALRYDYAREILPLYLSGEITPRWSAGHDTFEYGRYCWGDQVYDDRYIAGVVPFNREANFDDDNLLDFYEGWVPGETLPNLVEAWQEAWDTSVGTADPDRLTEIARGYMDEPQLIVHYLQPHAPYIGRRSLLGHTNNESATPLEGYPVDKPLWERVKHGETTLTQLRQAYRSNIHRVVEAALPLFRELCEQDRRVVVTSDHGECLGYFHPRLVSHPRISMPQIRKVPWMVVDGVREYPDPDADIGGSVSDRLHALGYK